MRAPWASRAACRSIGIGADVRLDGLVPVVDMMASDLEDVVGDLQPPDGINTAMGRSRVSVRRMR